MDFGLYFYYLIRKILYGVINNLANDVEKENIKNRNYFKIGKENLKR